MNIYAVGGWPAGVRYIMRICQPSTFLTGPGYPKAAVIETLALSFYLAPSWGTVVTADAVREGLAEYREPVAGTPSPWPEGWAVRPDDLKAGLDYSTPDLTHEDLRTLRDWYERVLGEVPRSVELYARHRPTLLKAERNRWENIVRTGLPNQMLAYLMIHYEVFHGRAAGAKEALLLGRGLGMSKQHAVDAVFYGGSFIGGLATMAEVADTVEEVLDDW
jgi:hypothetical protein